MYSSETAQLLSRCRPKFSKFKANRMIAGVLGWPRPEAVDRPVQGVHPVAGPQRGLPRPAGLPRLPRGHRQPSPQRQGLPRPEEEEEDTDEEGEGSGDQAEDEEPTVPPGQGQNRRQQDVQGSDLILRSSNRRTASLCKYRVKMKVQTRNGGMTLEYNDRPKCGTFVQKIIITINR